MPNPKQRRKKDGANKQKKVQKMRDKANARKPQDSREEIAEISSHKNE
jgi:hypothetical protein